MMTVILAIMLAFILGALCTLGALWFFVGRSEDEEYVEWLCMNETMLRDLHRYHPHVASAAVKDEQ